MNLKYLSKAVLTSVFPWYRSRLIEQAGGEVARECRAELWRQVRWQAECMSTPEIRGYARAYAAEFADAQVDDVLGRHFLRPALRLRVLISGIDQLVNMAVRDALSVEMSADVRPLAA